MLDLSPSLQDSLESFDYNDDYNPGREHTLKENVQRQFLKHISWQMSREKLSEIFLADQNSMAPLSKDTIRIKRQEKRKLGGRGLTNGHFQFLVPKTFTLKKRLNANRSFLLNTSFICVRIKKKFSHWLCT